MQSARQCLTLHGFVALLLMPLEGFCQQSQLPAGMVRLSEVAPFIRQDIRYAGTFNFTAARVPGYDAAQCILWRPAAEALLRVEKELELHGYALKVFDCYRPAQAVRAFLSWSRSPENGPLKRVFYPDFDKSTLFARGFISARSRHSRGVAVDVGLVRSGDFESAVPDEVGPCNGAFGERVNESSLDLGTTFDCFSPLSATSSRAVSNEAHNNRMKLVRALNAHGFSNYWKEWWHFEFNDINAPTIEYDFPVR